MGFRKTPRSPGQGRDASALRPLPCSTLWELALSWVTACWWPHAGPGWSLSREFPLSLSLPNQGVQPWPQAPGRDPGVTSTPQLIDFPPGRNQSCAPKILRMKGSQEAAPGSGHPHCTPQARDQVPAGQQVLNRLPAPAGCHGFHFRCPFPGSTVRPPQAPACLPCILPPNSHLLRQCQELGGHALAWHPRLRGVGLGVLLPPPQTTGKSSLKGEAEA